MKITTQVKDNCAIELYVVEVYLSNDIFGRNADKYPVYFHKISHAQEFLTDLLELKYSGSIDLTDNSPLFLQLVLNKYKKKYLHPMDNNTIKKLNLTYAPLSDIDIRKHNIDEVLKDL